MKRNNINKKFIKKEINTQLGLPDSLSENIVKTFFDIIVDGLIKDGEVKISSFGKFKILHKKARIGRNPKTKQEFNISERKVVVFYPSTLVKKLFNDKKEQSSI
tara:strand:+ start:457 stop:768 length:312 start_codon:yes stop_codon:yes gene_type:complete